jgi:DNA invertase Pin-like site-specific DNA recombinase
LRFVLYARASTKDKQHPEHQIAELRGEAARRQWTIVDELTEKESGRKADREVFAQPMDLVRTGKADGIACTELSRFGRSLPHLIEVSRELDARRAQLVCTRQPIDTTTAVGRLVFALLGAVAEFEADMTRERVRAGVRFAIAKRGGAWGRQREHVPRATVLAAIDLRTAGLSWRRTTARLYAVGHAQPASDRGRSAHPLRPWSVPTLQRAIASVQLPCDPGTPNPPPAAG